MPSMQGSETRESSIPPDLLGDGQLLFYIQKCDAGQPKCGPCVKIGRADRCSYDSTKSRLSVLQDRLEELESSIRRLQKRPSLPRSSLAPESPERTSLVHWTRLPFPGAIKLGEKPSVVFATDLAALKFHFLLVKNVGGPSASLGDPMKHLFETNDLPLEARETLSVVFLLILPH